MYFTVPETYDPTGTVVRGLIVPVAWTTDVMAPCSTWTVRNFGGSGLRFNVQAVAMATPAAAVATNNPTFNRLRLSGPSCIRLVRSGRARPGLTSHPNSRICRFHEHRAGAGSKYWLWEAGFAIQC